MTPPTIHPETTVGPVHLVVSDLERSVAFYRERLGFAVSAAARGEARLGTAGADEVRTGGGVAQGAEDLLVLRERRDAPRPGRTTGLFHFAVVVPSRRDLALSLERLIETRTPLTGASDHRVSEALYLDDPDGNGIEIYRDRPRADWPVTNGQVRMSVDPLDLDDLLREGRGREASWAGLPNGTRMGHIHLRVSHLPEAERFYVDVLGFTVRARYGDSALFLAAGDYHHHVGLNTWAGVGVPRPPEGAIGLERYVVRAPNGLERDRVASRARDADVEVEQVKDGYALLDPSGNHILLAEKQGA